MEKFIVGEIARRNRERFPEKIATVFGDQRETWLEFDRSTNRLANMLVHKGLKKGDRLAILSQNCDEYFKWYFGCAKAGVIVVPINYRLSKDEMIMLLTHSDPRVMIVGEDYLDAVEDLKDDLPLELYLGQGDEMRGWMVPYGAAVRSYPDAPSPITVDEDDVFCIMYTSGTTGLPKGAMSTHRNYVTNCMSVIHAQGIEGKDVNLVAPPLYHAGALFHSLSYMMLGCTQIVMKQFDTKKTLKTIQDERATSCLMIPTMLNFLLNDPNFDSFDTSSLTKIFYGGGPMPVALLERAMAKLKAVQFTQGYGLTETLEVTFLLPKDHLLNGDEKQSERLRSAGTETPYFEVKVIGEDGNDMPPGMGGEVCAKGPSIIKGFWKDPEQTKIANPDGWFRTGDIGMLDKDRYLFILDRKKDMIISGGENIYTKEVEDVLHAHPAILEAAVIGVPDSQWGEKVKAVVALKKDKDVSEEEVIEFCKGRLARYKSPKSVEFVGELPKNPSGKILKRELREKYKS
jgi:long-chain acyl-CoA synthetase